VASKCNATLDWKTRNPIQARQSINADLGNYFSGAPRGVLLFLQLEPGKNLHDRVSWMQQLFGLMRRTFFKRGTKQKKKGKMIYLNTRAKPRSFQGMLVAQCRRAT
jgi:hypothetical protein